MSAIDLQRFCARDHDPRDYFHQPWPHLGWLYATNGHIMVRVPSPADAETKATHSAAESAQQMFDSAKKGCYIGLPSFRAPAKCSTCGGAGKYPQMKCPDCDGNGHFQHGDYDYECKRCEEDGLIQAAAGTPGAEMMVCTACEGFGAYRYTFARVGDAFYDAVYLTMLANLPGVRVCTNGHEHAMHFDFDGGEGLLMPRRADA